MTKKSQLLFFKNEKSAYGGELLNTRKGRSKARPLDTKHSMHLNLKSSLATSEWSFTKPKNAEKIQRIVEKFSRKYGVRVYSMANVGNHLHFHIQLGNRYAYKPFIRAITSAIAMAITGASRWKKLKSIIAKNRGDKHGPDLVATDRFWDRRPFTRVIQGFRGLLNMKDYIQINQLEGQGLKRQEARELVQDAKVRPWLYRPPEYLQT